MLAIFASSTHSCGIVQGSSDSNEIGRLQLGRMQ